MKHKIVFIGLVFLLFSTAIINANEKNKELKKEETEKIKRMVILPFFNYSESGMKYVSTYIPELLKDRISGETQIEVFDYNDLKREIEIINSDNRKKIEVISDNNLYNTNKAVSFLKNINADFGIIGRYIIHEKIIKIDYKFIYVSNNKIVEGLKFEGDIEDRFLSVLENFAQSRGTIISEYMLKEKVSGVSRLIGADQTFLKDALDPIRQSKIGIILTNRWILSLLILLIFYILAKVTVFIIDRVLKQFTRKTETEVDDRIIEKSRKPTKWIVIFIGIKVAFLTLGFRDLWMRYVDSVIVAVIIILVTYIIANALSASLYVWGHKLTPKLNSRIDKDLVPLFVKVINFIVITIGVLMILSKFEIDIAPLIASLGIAGFAIGFAVKDTLANIIGGVILILDRSFAVGDKVVVDGDLGIIKEVGLRNTKLMTFDNEIVVIPNGELMNKKFKNFVLPDPKIRVVVKFGVAYGSDIDKVEEIVLKALMGMENICEDPSPAVIFTEMADFSLNMQAKFWVPDYADQYGMFIEGTKTVYSALVEGGVDIPFPTHTVFIEKNED